MNFILKDAQVYTDGKFTKQDVYILGGKLFLKNDLSLSDAITVSFKNKYIFGILLIWW